jgi:hypothetical protein
MSNQSSTAGGGVQYTLIFVNNSSQQGDACVYQQDPNIGPDVMSLSWFSKTAAPTTKIQFQWSIQYNFVWSQTGVLTPGVIFAASQTWDADLSTTNKVTLNSNGGAYSFQNQTAGPAPGNLYISETGTVAANAAVGVGMSGFGTFVVQTQPNWNLVFTPHPEYWITFGTYTQGEVMDITSVNNPAQIKFPANIYSMTAILNADNTWTIQSTSAVNAQFARDKRRYPELVWGQDPEDPTLARRGGRAGELPSGRYND